MSSILDPVLLGPLMVAFVTLWFLTMPVLFKERQPEPVALRPAA